MDYPSGPCKLRCDKPSKWDKRAAQKWYRVPNIRQRRKKRVEIWAETGWLVLSLLQNHSWHSYHRQGFSRWKCGKRLQFLYSISGKKSLVPPRRQSMAGRHNLSPEVKRRNLHCNYLWKSQDHFSHPHNKSGCLPAYSGKIDDVFLFSSFQQEMIALQL